MKIRRLLANMVLMSFMVMNLAGCKLAKPPVTVSESEEDKLVGIFITTDYMQINDESGRLYAKPAQTEFIAVGDSGESREIVKDYEFEGVEGVKYIAIYDKTSKGSSYSSQCFDEPLAWTRQNIKVSDSDTYNEHTIELLCELFVADKDLVLEINPVYKTAEGEVYAVNGSSMAVSSVGFTYKMEGTSTRTVAADADGFKDIYRGTISVSVSVVDPAKKSTLIFMSADNEEISRVSCISSELPEEIAVPDGTEYIVEETGNDTEIVRALYDRENNKLPGYMDRGDGICIKRLTEFVWEQEK